MRERKGLLFLTGIILGGCGGERLQPLSMKTLPPRPTTVTVVLKNYCPQNGARFRDLIVSNLSASVEKGIVLADFDRDAIPNLYDNLAELNISPRDKDTNGDGYSDLLMLLGGFTAEAQANIKECSTMDQDTDEDGLSDCEEEYLVHSHKQKIDTDSDAIPDNLEVRNGLNALDPFDAQQDLDGDGRTNLQEIKEHTPPKETNDELTTSFAYHYSFGPSETDPDCYDARVSNISIANVSNGNLISIFFYESDPLGIPEILSANVVVPRTTPDGAELEFDYTALFSGGL